MPFDIQVAERFLLGQRLLHDILTEGPLAAGVERAYVIRRLTLGNGKDSYVRGIPPGGLAGPPQS
jgi:hypothetical protein